MVLMTGTLPVGGHRGTTLFFRWRRGIAAGASPSYDHGLSRSGRSVMMEPKSDVRENGSDRTTTHRIEISFRTILAIVLTIAGLWLLRLLLPILVVVVTSLMLVGTLNPYIAALQRRGLRRSLAIAAVVGLGAALMVALGLMTVPALLDQVTNAVNDLPTMQGRLTQLLSTHRVTMPLADAVRSFKPEKSIQSFNVGSAVAASLGVFDVLGDAATAAGLAIYF